MIKELSIFEFDEFVKKHPLASYHQTSSYAMLMNETDYDDYDLIGYFDDTNTLLAASMILIKKISWHYYYGYAPKGFLIDYTDKDLVKKWTTALKEFYSKKQIVFIKINPEIAIGELIKGNNYDVYYNPNVDIIETLKNLGYIQLKQNLNFEAILPRFNAIINLNKFSLNNVSKNVRNKINKSERFGLHLEKVNKDYIETLYTFIKSKKNRSIDYYRNYFYTFDKNDNVDLFLVKINYNDFLVNTQKRYNLELEKNNEYNELLVHYKSPKFLNQKIESDKVIQGLKNDILFATNMLKMKQEDYIAGALIIKYNNRIYFIRTGFDKKFSNFGPNQFLYYKIMEHYKNNYSFADLNGVTGDMTKDNPFYKLNQFKLSFNPRIYEFIGEFDLPINKKIYEILDRKNILFKNFKKED